MVHFVTLASCFPEVETAVLKSSGALLSRMCLVDCTFMFAVNHFHITRFGLQSMYLLSKFTMTMMYWSLLLKSYEEHPV